MNTLTVTDKQLALIDLALWKLMNQAYSNADYHARDKSASDSSKVSLFLADAKECELLRKITGKIIGVR